LPRGHKSEYPGVLVRLRICRHDAWPIDIEAESARVVIRALRDERGTRHLATRRRDDGGIVIEGHDLGRGVEVLGPGLSEYEWVWTIPPDAVLSAIEALGGKEVDNPLQLLVGWSTDHGGIDPGTHLREAGITIAFWSHLGD
jgi:hypothetical protein